MGRRSPRGPHIVQASELGAAFLLEQKDLVRPLWQVVVGAEAGFGAEELLDGEGRLLALPLGRATPVLYYNRDAFRAAGLDPANGYDRMVAGGYRGSGVVD
jgi:sn-glycerol 3-phosphate transport system substrate-binding protein